MLLPPAPGSYGCYQPSARIRRLNRLTQVKEYAGQAVQHNTGYTYDAASNLKTRTHDGASSAFEYDIRNLLAAQTDTASGSDTSLEIIGHEGTGASIDYSDIAGPRRGCRSGTSA